MTKFTRLKKALEGLKFFYGIRKDCVRGFNKYSKTRLEIQDLDKT